MQKMSTGGKMLFYISIFAIFIFILIFSGSLDKFIIRKSFEKAFFYRAIGDCESFLNYVYNQKEYWNKNCLSEKSRETVPITDFNILRINYSRRDRKAYLQVELTRDKKTYSANYEMIRNGFRGLITKSK